MGTSSRAAAENVQTLTVLPLVSHPLRRPTSTLSSAKSQVDLRLPRGSRPFSTINPLLPRSVHSARLQQSPIDLPPFPRLPTTIRGGTRTTLIYLRRQRTLKRTKIENRSAALGGVASLRRSSVATRRRPCWGWLRTRCIYFRPVQDQGLVYPVIDLSGRPRAAPPCPPRLRGQIALRLLRLSPGAQTLTSASGKLFLIHTKCHADTLVWRGEVGRG